MPQTILNRFFARFLNSRTGTYATGRIRRLYTTGGLDDNTVIDSCDLFVQEHGNSVNRAITTPACEDMGRIGSAENFVQYLGLSAETRQPVSLG